MYINQKIIHGNPLFLRFPETLKIKRLKIKIMLKDIRALLRSQKNVYPHKTKKKKIENLEKLYITYKTTECFDNGTMSKNNLI